MFRFSTILLCVFFCVQIATANSEQEELLNTYGKFQAAMIAKDYKLARGLAQKAWETSETLYGATQQTGDFAFNYASIGEKLDGTKKNKDVEKAFKRSIELTKFYSEKANEVSVQRHQKYHAYLVSRSKSKLAKEFFATTSEFASTHGLVNTESYAKLQKTQAEYYYIKRSYKDAETLAKAAIDTFRTSSIAPNEETYDARFTLAKSQTHLGKHLSAISNFQTIWANQEDILEPNDPLVGLAYVWALGPTLAYYEENDLSWDANETFSDCDGCWPNIAPKYLENVRKTQKYSVVRHPPAYPEKAEFSGFTALLFDTDDNGKANNIRIIDRSHKDIFDKPSIDSVKKWVVKLKDTDEPAKNLKDLVAPMKFILKDHKGRYIDFYGIPSKG